MPFTTWASADLMTAAKLNNDNTIAVATDTARTITVTHTWTAAQTFTGGWTAAAACTISAGGIAVTGNSTITGTLTALTGITSSGTAALGTITAATVTTTSDIFGGATTEIGWTGRATMKSSADGIIELYNDALSSFTRLCLGGTTSSFPAIVRTSNVLDFKLADNSAFCQIEAKNLTVNAVAAATGAGEVNYGATTQTTIGANGAASALTANPVGYLIISIAGSTRTIPYYNP